MFPLFKTAPKADSPEPQADRRTVAPRVDIRETGEAVIVVADMPGVDAAGVDVQIHGDVLTLRGASRSREPEHFQAIWREYACRDYQRSFRLGHAIDAERIAATAKDGIVRVTLPKRAAAQPKRIAVTAG